MGFQLLNQSIESKLNMKCLNYEDVKKCCHMNILQRAAWTEPLGFNGKLK
jgi:hypothetical protein